MLKIMLRDKKRGTTRHIELTPEQEKQIRDFMEVAAIQQVPLIDPHKEKN